MEDEDQIHGIFSRNFWVLSKKIESKDIRLTILRFVFKFLTTLLSFLFFIFSPFRQELFFEWKKSSGFFQNVKIWKFAYKIVFHPLKKILRV